LTKKTVIDHFYSTPTEELIRAYPVCRSFFENTGLMCLPSDLPPGKAISTAEEDFFTSSGQTEESILRDFCSYFEEFVLKSCMKTEIEYITITGGKNKNGEKEIEPVTIKRGEIISIVGPTGSGKSQLLADIECLACSDTPTGRRILINGSTPQEHETLDLHGKLISQLSQNMNFVMDLTVEDFLRIHAGSMSHTSTEEIISKCFKAANALAGEKFSLKTRVTQLSGGQSRALMIADTAYMSDAPIVLIDEIENAGIDRQKAAKLLADRARIVLISTHDPLLAMSADKRIVISNGGISDVIETSASEKACIETIKILDDCLTNLRNELRNGSMLDITSIAADLGKLKGEIT